MTTFTLDLPEELVQRMTTAGDADWSTIARKAFESHLKRLASRDESGPLSAAIDRLRTSCAEAEDSRSDHRKPGALAGGRMGRTG